MSKRKILVVDDEIGARTSLRMVFKDAYEILEAGNGEEALKILQDTRPDVILLDVIMPRMNGIEVLRQIKSIDKELPVIVITAIKNTEMGREAMKLGAFAYLAKPFDVVELQQLAQRALKASTILVVDDEVGVRESLRMVLKDNYNVLTAAGGQEGLEMIKKDKPSLVILDVKMPDIDGIEVLKQTKDICPQLPVIVVTGVGTHQIAIEALKLGAADFIVKPINAGYVRQIIENALTGGDKKMFAGNSLPSTEEALKDAYLDTLKSLSKAIESKDLYTKRHSELVAKYAVEIAKELGLSTEEIEVMEQTALLHDIGKISIKDSVLNKPGKLNSEEWEEIKKHPLVGEEMIRPFKLLHIEQTMIRHHHERFDGSGYPDKLKGEETPIYARILAVADSFEAMVADRPYRSKLSLEEAKKELERCKGTQFDPKVVDAFLEVLRKTPLYQEERNGKTKEENSFD